MGRDFEILEHTADAGIRAYGADMPEAFANAARGLFSLITELDDIEEVEYRDIELTAPDQDSLLVQWLNELIYLFDADNLVFKRFDIEMLICLNRCLPACPRSFYKTRFQQIRFNNILQSIDLLVQRCCNCLNSYRSPAVVFDNYS